MDTHDSLGQRGLGDFMHAKRTQRMVFTYLSLLFLLFEPQNSTYITEISLPALCLLLLIAGLGKTHWKDRLQRKTAGTPSFFMFLHVEPTRNNPMYNRYRHVLPGLNSLHTPGIGCKAPFFLPGYPVHLYLHIYPIFLFQKILKLPLLFNSKHQVNRWFLGPVEFHIILCCKNSLNALFFNHILRLSSIIHGK